MITLRSPHGRVRIEIIGVAALPEDETTWIVHVARLVNKRLEEAWTEKLSRHDAAQEDT